MTLVVKINDFCMINSLLYHT